jgi:N6-adenosine-specific RNA methylase IME4
MMTKYEIIYADPPWNYGGQKMLSGSKAENHYPTMKLSELKALPVQSITDDNALLFMWSSSPHLDQAIELMKAWGFSYATVAFVWDKVRPVSGFYTMSQCEICLVGKKGKIPQPRGVRNALQFLSEKKGRHSAKVDKSAHQQLYQLIYFGSYGQQQSLLPLLSSVINWHHQSTCWRYTKHSIIICLSS